MKIKYFSWLKKITKIDEENISDINIKDIESLAKSYVHAQKLVGADKIPVPNKFATEKEAKVLINGE